LNGGGGDADRPGRWSGTFLGGTFDFAAASGVELPQIGPFDLGSIDISLGGIWELLQRHYGLDFPGTSVPPVIEEIPRGVYGPSTPGDTGIPSKVDVQEWPDWSLEPILETRPGRTPDPYPGTEAWETEGYEEILRTQTPLPVDDEDVDMAHDWGHLIRGGIDTIFGISDPGQPDMIMPPAGGWPATPSAATPGTTPSGKYCVDPKTGKVTMVHHHRRRRLLTESDFNDLMRISTLPNKETVKIALAKAIGRRH